MQLQENMVQKRRSAVGRSTCLRRYLSEARGQNSEGQNEGGLVGYASATTPGVCGERFHWRPVAFSRPWRGETRDIR